MACERCVADPGGAGVSELTRGRVPASHRTHTGGGDSSTAVLKLEVLRHGIFLYVEEGGCCCTGGFGLGVLLHAAK